MRSLVMVALLLLAVSAVEAQSRPQTIEVDVVLGATGYELESSPDGVTWTRVAAVLPAACAAGRCPFVVTPPVGITHYRWSYLFGTAKQTRVDAWATLCHRVPASCPPVLVPSGVGVR